MGKRKKTTRKPGGQKRIVPLDTGEQETVVDFGQY